MRTFKAEIEASPEQIADAFWAMDNLEQVEFFARLDDIAGHNLCRQMAWVVLAMVRRADKGDHRAWLAFRTMFEHAHEYHKDALEIRCERYEREVSKNASA